MKPTITRLQSMLAALSLTLPQVVLSETTDNTSTPFEETEILGTYKKNDFQDKERAALNVIDTLDAEAIERFGDSAAGDAIKRVVGVSLVGSKYAVIRGLQGRFIATTLNSSAMPSLNPTRRDVALDIFPASILGGIEIEKSYRPELPGNTTGGLINLATKKPGDYVNKLSIGTSLTTGVTGKKHVTYKGSKTDALGFDSGIRKLPSSINNATDFGKPGTSSSVRGLGNDFNHIYDVDKRKAGPDASFSYAYGDSVDMDNGSLSAYGSVAYSNASKARQNAMIDNAHISGTYQRSVTNTDISGYLALGYEDDSADNSYQSKTIYLHQASDTTRVDKLYDKSEESSEEKIILQWIENTYVSQQFSGSHFFADQAHNLNWLINAGQTHRHEPDRRQYSILGGAPNVFSLERRYADMTENSIDLAINYLFDTAIGDIGSTKLKAGIYTNQKNRDAKLARFGFNDNGVQAVGKSMEQIFSDKNFDDGKIYATVKTTKSDNYTAKETLNAAYLSSETTLFEDLDFTLGARFESNTQSLNFSADSRQNNTHNANDLLPVFGVAYRLNEEFQVKASVSQTVSRPGMTERSSSKFYDPETDDLFFGNNKLQQSNIQNADLRAEYFYDDLTNISIALFLKNIDAPIEKTKFSSSGSAGEGYTFINQESAALQGIEVDFAAGLFDTGSWLGFLSGNVSYIDAEVTLTQASRAVEFNNPSTRQLQGQSDVLANLQFGVDHIATNQQVSLSANYFSDRIHRVEVLQANKIEEGAIKLNAVYKWEMDESFSFTAKVNNILDTKTQYSSAGKTIESYHDGVGVSVNVGMNF